jgi:hypothetical protein
MVKAERPYRKRRRVFLWMFLLSTSIFLVLILILRSGALRYIPELPTPTANPTFSPTPSPTQFPVLHDSPFLGPNEATAMVGSIVAALGSCVTSIVTFIGFVSTLVLGWRKESREAQDSKLERQRLALELEKQRLDLEKAKAEEDAKRHRPEDSE